MRVMSVRCTAQRAWSCSRYAVEPSRPVVGKAFNFKHIPHKMTHFQYSECPENVPKEMWGGQAGGGGAGGGGLVQDKLLSNKHGSTARRAMG